MEAAVAAASLGRRVGAQVAAEAERASAEDAAAPARERAPAADPAKALRLRAHCSSHGAHASRLAASQGR